MMKINVPSVLTIVMVLSFLSSCELRPYKTRSNKTQTKRPNILLLMSDNQSAEHLGCYGDTSIKTPHIDRLAKKGLIFKNVQPRLVRQLGLLCLPVRIFGTWGRRPIFGVVSLELRFIPN